ncbi:hypothetical protein PTE30175_04801 [Pandoraea terrae]|uniref:DUF4224 domain-containing protein n=1 Tax=Pandoraea terrae TaxID=1537710 RepID=A0A5E4YYP5_9BURK|nr:DUF4224 domain-containing protein [Pandoraea terrae]VVE54071.1 hypothetical protein PTE30175_04801 [Pandoraea terrae]
MTQYLSRNELRALTGTPIRLRQLRWLATNGWPHAVDTRGRVLVARAYHDKRMGIISSAPALESLPAVQPPLNLSAI